MRRVPSTRRRSASSEASGSVISSPVSRNVATISSRRGSPRRGRWRSSASVCAPAQCRSSSTSSVGHVDVAASSTWANAPYRRYRSASASAPARPDARLTKRSALRSSAHERGQAGSQLPVGSDEDRHDGIEGLHPWLVRAAPDRRHTCRTAPPRPSRGGVAPARPPSGSSRCRPRPRSARCVPCRPPRRSIPSTGRRAPRCGRRTADPPSRSTPAPSAAGHSARRVSSTGPTRRPTIRPPRRRRRASATRMVRSSTPTRSPAKTRTGPVTTI